MDEPWSSNGGGFVGNGWVGERRSPSRLVFVSTARSSIGQTGSPVTRSKTYVYPCLLTCAIALMSRPSTVISRRLGWVGELVGYDDSLNHEPPFGYYDALPQPRR